MEERKSRFGHEGYAQVAERLQTGKMGVAGEREKVEEVVDGGERVDFKGMLMGLAKADCGEGTEEVEDKGESDMSLLLSSDMTWRVEKGEAMAMSGCGEVRYLVERNMKTFCSGTLEVPEWVWSGRSRVGIWGI